MSNVTNAILTYPITNAEGTDHIPLEAVNKFFENSHNVFVHVKDPKIQPRLWYSRHKCLECNVAIAALNHVNIEDLVLHIQQVDWEEPENVQLFLQEQEEDTFSERLHRNG
jgi:hypothetical protein